jgi:thiol-disulfide isomerase/thioredoxin
MLDQLLKLPKQLLQSYKRLPQTQKLVVFAVLALAGWWLWKNYLAQKVMGMEGFAESGAKSIGTLTCTMYYVNWCPHCKDAKPEWAKLTQALNGKMLNGKKVLITSVDCEKFPEMAKRQNIGGYPTFKFDLDGRQLQFQGERKFDAFKRFIESVAYSDFQ